MSYYSRFEDGFVEEAQQLDQRRMLVLNAARAHEPEDLSEQLAASETLEVDQELDWVQVPDPRDNGRFLTVRPVLTYWPGSEADAEEKDRYDQGIGGIMLEGRLPDGTEHVIGMMSVFYSVGQIKHPPTLSINMSIEDGMGEPVDWASADAELWLKTAAAALDAQT